MERVAWKHIHSVCKIASGNFLYESGNSNQGSVTEGRDGIGGGRQIQEGGNICIPMADSC